MLLQAGPGEPRPAVPPCHFPPSPTGNKSNLLKIKNINKLRNMNKRVSLAALRLGSW